MINALNTEITQTTTLREIIQAAYNLLGNFTQNPQNPEGAYLAKGVLKKVLDMGEEMAKDAPNIEATAPKTADTCPLKILSVFSPADRLDELDEVPKLSNGWTDYWKAAQLLCKKDGGRLPTKEELAKLASYIYGEEITVKNSDRTGLTVKNMPEVLKPIWDKYGWFTLWASSENSDYDDRAETWYFGSDNTGLNYGNRNRTVPQVVCVGSPEQSHE